MKNDPQPWTILHSEYLIRRPWLTARRDHVRLPDGTENPDHSVLEYPDWVNVIARTQAGRFVLIRQYRHGLRQTAYEVCAGCIDPEDASPEVAARRELMEETGYGGGTWKLLPVICGNPSTTNNLTYCFVAEGVEKVDTQHLEATEDITVHLLTKDELMSILHGLKAKGIDIGFDIYSELLGVSVITVVLPAWYQALSPAKKRHWFNKLKLGALIRATILLLGFGWDDIQIAYIGKGYEQYEGKSVSQIAKEMGKSCLDAYLDLCEMSDFKGRVNMGPYSTPEIVSELSKDDRCLYMTDAWVEDHGVQNPAIYDCFPKFLKFSLCGTGDTMPNTIRKMTGGVADRFSIKDRGYIKPGCYADLTVFDEAKLRNGQPDQQASFGIEKVYINGVKVLDGETLDTEAIKTSGRAMR